MPDTVAGMWEAQKRFGRLSWKQVLAPAIHYARDGFAVSEQLQQRRDDAAKDFGGKTNFDKYFGNLNKGVTFKQPELAATLSRIAAHGAKEFYIYHFNMPLDEAVADPRGRGVTRTVR